MNYEEKILTYLVDNYRKSKKDTGSNKTNRRTKVKPEKLYRKYNSNDGDYGEITKLNDAVASLTKVGFVYCDVETFGTGLKSIYLVDDKLNDIERYMADNYGYITKDEKLKKLENLVESYGSSSHICSRECLRLSEQLKKRKLPNNIDEIEDVLKALAFIESNDEELYIREASIKIYGDSKFFEEKTLQPVCNILKKYLPKGSTGKLSSEVLQQYNIKKEPQKLCIKGNATINISGKNIDISVFSEGIEFMVSDIENINEIKVNTPYFMTVENFTSYLRYAAKDTVTFYLGGYAGRYQCDFIKKICDCNPSVKCRHFGDIDAGGFLIHRNLCEITGVDFDLFCMSVNELQAEAYAGCLHELSENDRKRLSTLQEDCKYADVVSYMLKNNVKLEQEIVSLMLMLHNSSVSV